MPLRRAQYAVWSTFISTVTNVIIEGALTRFKYALYREETNQNFTFVGAGIAEGSPSQTLEVVEAEARGFIRSLRNWDTSTMSVYISIYEVLNPCLLARSTADVR